MGTIKFLGKFIPNVSYKTAYLTELLQHNKVFEWTAQHEKEWGKKLKEILITELVFTFFDYSKRTKISIDASNDSLGAVLLQAEGDKWQPAA